MTIITDDMIIKNVISPALVVGMATDYSYTCIFIIITIKFHNGINIRIKNNNIRLTNRSIIQLNL